MNGFERMHECVGCFTDAGQWHLTNEPIVRCKESFDWKTAVNLNNVTYMEVVDDAD